VLVEDPETLHRADDQIPPAVLADDLAGPQQVVFLRRLRRQGSGCLGVGQFESRVHDRHVDGRDRERLLAVRSADLGQGV
jgi:hypothetical protein